MAIHFENYKTFSKGQGFIGVACRTKSPQASTPRLFASDCLACKQTLVGRHIISRAATTAIIESADSSGVWALMGMTGETHRIMYQALDTYWAPFDLDEIFGMKGDA